MSKMSKHSYTFLTVQRGGLCVILIGLLLCLPTEIYTASVSAEEKTVYDTEAGIDSPDCEEGLIKSECVEQARQVILNYKKALRRNKDFDLCGKFSEVTNCLTAQLEECSHSKRHSKRDWIFVIKHIDMFCNNASREVKELRECFEREMRGPLAMRCDEYYKFNIQQQTKSDCYFLRERLHCKEALVSSACGTHQGNFAFHLLRVTTEKHRERIHCNINKDTQYKAFRYTTDKCSVEFLMDAESCTTRHLTEDHIALFHTDNDLVALGNNKQMKAYCRAFRRFRHCLQPTVDSCRQGLELFLDYEGSLRRYILKMDHICHEDDEEVYISSMDCYQEVMKNGSLDQCTKYWNDLKPWLNTITAYQFYCQADHINTINLLQELAKSEQCHSSVFEAQCGFNSSRVMTSLISKALHDPLYLRLGYRPDCLLHNESHRSQPSDQSGAGQLLDGWSQRRSGRKNGENQRRSHENKQTNDEKYSSSLSSQPKSSDQKPAISDHKNSIVSGSTRTSASLLYFINFALLSCTFVYSSQL